MRFDEVIKKYGYPIISKEVSAVVSEAKIGFKRGDGSYQYCIMRITGTGKYAPKDGKKSADWFAKGAEKSDITTRLFAVFRYWRIGETQTALKLCGEIGAQSKKSLAAIEEKSPDGIQAMIVKQTLKTVERMQADISGGKPAPENTGAYLNGNPTPN